MRLHALAAVLLIWPLSSNAAGDHVERHRLGVWTLEKRTDLFTGAVSCRLFAPHMDYTRGAVVVRLSRLQDTSQAVYRVDAGRPVETRSEEMDMARAGFALRLDSLDNPSGGLVRIPATRLIAARSVWIRAGPRDRPVEIRTEGLAKALDAARGRGCETETFGGGAAEGSPR